MKNLLILIASCLTFAVSNANTYYVSPTGNDSNPGTLAQPFLNLSKLSIVLRAGDIAYVRGGVYNSTAGNGASIHFLLQNLTGTSSSPITIQAYPGEVPMFNCANITPTNDNPFLMVVLNSSYVKLKGFVVKNLKQVASGNGVSRGFMFQHSNNCTLELFDIFNIGGTGFTFDHSDYNLILNCDSHNNGDGMSPDTWNFGDGFTSTGGDPSSNNTFSGCRTWMNGDDGWDFFAWSGTKVTITNCWSFWNSIKPWGLSGTQPDEATMTPADPSLWANNTAYRTSTTSGEGFKLGGFNVGGPGPVGMPTTLKKYLDHCVSFENSGTGFTANMEAQYSHQMQLLNCISYNNGNDGFGFGTGRSTGIAMIFKNCVSANNNKLQSGADWVYDGLPNNISNNDWASTYQGVNYGNLAPGIQATTADFLSVTSTGVTGARQADGSLPNISFLKLNTTSDLVNAGINVGLPFVSTAPDLGACESNGSTSNITPTSNAGADQTITLPVNSVSLNGSGTDPDGTIASYAWTKLSGPSSGTIGTPAAATTSVSGMIQGVYQFQLTVTDNKGATGTDIVQVIVNPVVVVTNTAPTANAGADKTVTLPTTTVSLSGSGADANGTISAYRWTKISGPTSAAITTATAASTTVTALVQGVYRFELKVTDNAGATGKDTVQVTVNAAGNIAPVVNAGADIVITSPTVITSLSGSATDADGTIASYSWTKVSGPTGLTITTPLVAVTTITALVQGVYKFELKATDNGGAIGRDTVQVTVNALPSSTTAYGGVRWAIPGKIEAENFDNGGMNVAYYDDSRSNFGNYYRTTEAVDIQASSEGSPNIGWIAAGEWMKYSVNVTAAANYTLGARVAASAAGKSFRVEMDGVTIATVTVPNTGSTQTWQTVNMSGIALTAGTKTMRIYAISGGSYNLNYVTFTKGTVAARVAEAGTSVTAFAIPLSNSYTISLNDEATGLYSLSLLNAAGKEVWKKEVNKSSNTTVTETVYMGNLANGEYELQVTDPAGEIKKTTLNKN
ncbi:hypothetical protein BH11BAC4_BH11BAC4_08070 [soil metagenome]